MKRLSIPVFVIALCFGCTKKPEPAPVPVAEANIVFTTDATNNSISLGSSFPVVVTLTSAMPSASGIKIESTVTDQTTGTAIPQTAITSTAVKNTYTLNSLPKGHWCDVVIKISSIATATNNASQTFTVAYK